MKSTISYWYGRLGNNIQQISNALFYCKTNKKNFFPLNHPLINLKKTYFGSEECIQSRFFFYNGQEKDFNTNITQLNDSRRSICLEHITPNFNFFIDKPYDDDFVVIHIRGGDVFIKNPPNTYVQNPLNFYLSIIEKFEFCIVVAEDFNNPIVQNLKNHHKVIVQSTNLENDFSTLLRAKHLVSSGVGTFSLAAALCSNNITDFYCTNLCLEEHLNYKMLLKTNIRIHLTKLNNYIKIGEWCNSEDQLQTILKHKIG